MAGTKAGGLKAAKKNLANDPNFYREIGKIGGQNGHTGGFFGAAERARRAGRLGGLVSRKGKTNLSLEERREKAKRIIKERGEE